MQSLLHKLVDMKKKKEKEKEVKALNAAPVHVISSTNCFCDCFDRLRKVLLHSWQF